MFMVEVDLNLLRVFDTLYELRSVTRAAARLGLTQSAISHALGRLRRAIDDPLFVRAPGGLQPTARAEEIAPGVREGLVQLRGALSPTVFEPASATRRFTIAAGAYFCVLLVPELIARLRAIAPDVVVRIQPLGPELLSELDESSVDLALGAFTRVPSRLTKERLYREELVWIAAADNPLADAPFDHDALAAAPRLTIAVGRPFEALRAAAPIGVLERKVIADTGEAVAADIGEDSAAVYDALTAIAIVGRTDMVALVPRRFAERDDARAVVALDAPEESGGIDLMMLWHGKFDEDAGLAWLRGVIRALVAGF
ncbi:LysR family transcriptional regulator [Sphingomonas koreensis]|nr:LysR family transcriptional regulator [Sphingomonas koreensis]